MISFPLVELSAEQEVTEIQRPDRGEGPVQEVQPPLVKVLRQPPGAPVEEIDHCGARIE